MKNGDSFDQSLHPHLDQEVELICQDQDDVVDVASGTYFNGQLWAFYPAGRARSRRRLWIRYQQLNSNGSWSWSSRKMIKNSATDYAVSPVIFNTFLYVFWKGHVGGKLYYTRYMGLDEQGNDKWDTNNKIDIKPDGVVAPVYNPQQKRLEVYFKGLDNRIYYWYTYNGYDWSGGRLPGLQTWSAPAAEVVEIGNGQYQIMVAHRRKDNSKINIDFINYDKNNQAFCEKDHILDDRTENPPHLAYLGDGRTALLYRGCNDKSYARFYKEVYHEPKDVTKNWGPTITKYNREANCFHVRGAAYYISRDPSTEGADLDGYLMVFYTKKRWLPATPFHYFYALTYQAEFLGVWKRDKITEKDWSLIDDKKLQKKHPEESVWNLYPVVGVMDTPPRVLNGGKIADNNTMVTFKHCQEISTTTEWKFKAGVYAKAGSQLPFTLELHKGLQRGEKEIELTTQSVSYDHTIESFYGSMDEKTRQYPQYVGVIYLAPTTRVTRYKFYEPGKIEPTRELDVVEILSVSLLRRYRNAAEDFCHLPNHQPHELKSYWVDTTKYDLLIPNPTGLNWERDKSEKTYGIQKEKIVSKGGTLSFKLGGGLADTIGFGFEGEYDTSVDETTTTKDSIHLVFDNPKARKGVNTDISGFQCTPCWLMIKSGEKDADWIPRNRQGTGDRPWFFTYNAVKYKSGGKWKIIGPKEIVPAVENE